MKSNEELNTHRVANAKSAAGAEAIFDLADGLTVTSPPWPEPCRSILVTGGDGRVIASWKQEDILDDPMGVMGAFLGALNAGLRDKPERARNEGGAARFSEAELKAAFQKVITPGDWKGPIDAMIDENERVVVTEAIIYYTATSPNFYVQSNGQLRVMADGYRNGPAGP